MACKDTFPNNPALAGLTVLGAFVSCPTSLLYETTATEAENYLFE